jgi:hypothetical protein
VDEKPNLFRRTFARMQAHPVLWLFLITFAVTAFLNPVKVGLFAWAVSKLAGFAFLGHWIDSRFFADAQPNKLQGIEQGTAWKRKALIIAAAIVAGALA